ncbi:adenylate/guanylate cyclase domain-containing protein [Mesorhizobium sp. WSM2239]|uniref:Adenylate/guanylate cyclase domain-containing protein n=2 Tax=unclassified Mesorhizobium TaxID=325217 RepID=A0AAU8DD72_9HYPH
MDIGQWLRELGLPAYEQAFRDNGVDLDVLPRLTADDLKEIGVSAVGHRRKILDAVGQLTAARPEAMGRNTPHRAERRQLTVMFCDLVGSTSLSASLDPEDMQELLGVYHARVGYIASKHGGFVAKYMGDGVLIYFGYPQAHEDDAERAVRSGLALVEGISELTTVGARLNARVGIATGLVVVGDLIGAGEAQERGIAGETPNLAARLQELAETGAVVIAETTRRLIGDLFELSSLGPSSIKGFAQAVPVWRVMGEGKSESRFEALHGAGITPLVGRTEELELVLSRWRQVKEGTGQVTLISGEPGIGKSRLVLALRERLQGEPKVSLTYACSPHHSNSALFPFVAQLERAAGFSPDDSGEIRLDKLQSLLRETAEAPDSAVVLIADLLGIPVGSGDELAEMSALQKKGLLFRAFLAQIEALAARSPVLVVLEDVHWLDPTSRELFDQIVERLQSLPMLLVATFRPELSPPWIGFPHVTLLTLNRLAHAQARSLVERVTSGKEMPPEVLEQILARTEGVPLFTEELTKAVLESGLLKVAGDCYVLDGPLPPLAIPATLHDSLMARLDRLASVKEIAQIGACIGREFDHELLAAVVPLAEADLGAALDRLVAAELVFRRGTPPAATYIFKHALVRDAAYQSLLRKRRQELHARLATALVRDFPQKIDTRPEVVARHFHEAGIFDKAVEYWLRGGRLAAGRSANVEAIAHLQSGLASLAALSPGEPRTRLELSLQLALGGPLLATKGFASREAEAVYKRAQELSRELRRDTDLFTAIRGLGYVYHVRANLREATELVDESIELARRIGDPAMLVEAYHFAGAPRFHAGKFQAARDWHQQSLEAGGYRGRFHSEVYGINMGVFCRAYISHCDWHLGYPDRALRIAEEGLALAREVAHPFSMAIALDYLAMLHQFRREPEAALKMAEEARLLCKEYRFDYYGAWSALIQAWAIAEHGHHQEALEAYGSALDQFRETGALLRMPHYLCLLAVVQHRAGCRDAGLRTIAEAAQIAERNREIWCNAELERERGELLLLEPSDDDSKQAEAAFERAMAIAADQGAKMLELRASAALARFWAERGECGKAFYVLAPSYDWFAEGFDTPDLRQAGMLLDELRPLQL